jgi:S-adenosyl methyltransferase
VVKQARAGDGLVPAEPNPARVYDYFLGGRDNYRVDRNVADLVTAEMPEVAEGARATRAVLGRVVRYLVGEAGIRQFLDIGAGLPTRENVHQIAQRADPAARVVYVDNDPVVLAYGRALLADNPATVVAGGDLRDPAGIIADPLVRGHLDWSRPMGLLLGGVLPEIMDHERPEEITATLIDALPAGSYVFIQHLLIMDDPKVDGPRAARLQEFMARSFGRFQFRTLDQVRGFFHGLEFVDPGLVPAADWRPDSPAGDQQAKIARMACAGVAVKPAGLSR